MQRAFCILMAGLGAALAPPATAHETDQYTVPQTRDLADLRDYFSEDAYHKLTDAVRKTNDRIQRSLRDGQPTAATQRLQSPGAIAWALYTEYPPVVHHIESLEIDVRRKELKDRYPGLLTAFRPIHWIYDHPLLLIDITKPVRNVKTSTILVNGVYIGTDKFAHFIHVGYPYYLAYRRAREQGLDVEAASHQGGEVGYGAHPLYSERTLLGGFTTGVYSNADLAANYAGMLFFRNLTEEVRIRGELRPPMLVRDGQLWRLADYVQPHSDFYTDFITPHWNEALNPNDYTPGVTTVIRRQIKRRCDDWLAVNCDRQAKPRSQQYFTNLLDELSTLYGDDYGHIGDPHELAGIATCCFDDDASEPADLSLTGDGNAPEPTTTQDPTTIDQPDALGRTALWWAARNGDTAEVERLVSAGADPNTADIDGETPLHVAARAGHHNIVRVLLEHGSQPDHQSRYGLTPLHLAVQESHADTVAALLDAGANVNVADAFGCTPLHDAVTQAAVTQAAGPLVARLLAAGADPYHKNNFGVSPFDRASTGGNEAVAALLESAGARPDHD